ncbi:Bifunctional dethiobiotin synthetase/7 [Forsythia ovata]|uniref:Bifunctional dethiobiotin synthetase/7 n=1 Tax=Forsythia ovata TaxID=205694 RepID=A0ABD1VLL2_9LAMI
MRTSNRRKGRGSTVGPNSKVLGGTSGQSALKFPYFPSLRAPKNTLAVDLEFLVFISRNRSISPQSFGPIYDRNPPNRTLHNLYLRHSSIDLLTGYASTVIQAAGGMQMVDPIFQRILVREYQSWKIPVIFYEVLTGFWRLGTEVILCRIAVLSARYFLFCQVDDWGHHIPLAATLASDAVFKAFVGDSKLWDSKLVCQISLHPAVHRVVALGTL